MSIIPDPLEAARLRVQYAGNPIVDLAEQALRAFVVDDARQAFELLTMWARQDELSPRECRAVVARFVPEPEPSSPAAVSQVPAVANALHVLGCVTRSNAAALLDLTTVQLSEAERVAVLAVFPLEVFPGAGRHMGKLPAVPGMLCACGRPAVRVDLTEHAGEVPTCGQHPGREW
ncbi:hypothetical protein ABT369_05330 [Dactylosporangium sp. NPDC000244]|uniref:hypothetical protein n=1 Tax=Dactylosporangium sp. NPDC000244 TaxID=3154365 RepID=UPI003322B4FA